MGRDLADAYAECREIFEQADTVLGYDLSRICFEGPEQELTRTQHCQPAIFVTSVAAVAALRRHCPGLSWSAMAGLSLGEWTALHVAGALSFDDALRVIEARGRFMQEACDAREGAMVSIIGMSEEDVRTICEETGADMANINSPGQIVLSGPREVVDTARGLAEERGARKAMLLKVAGAYHSSLMESAASKLKEALAGIEVKEPAVPVMANASGRWHTDCDGIRRELVRQVTSCVQWVRNVEGLRDAGIGEVIECGPGKVLTGLIKRIDREISLHNIRDMESLDKTVENLGGERET